MGAGEIAGFPRANVRSYSKGVFGSCKNVDYVLYISCQLNDCTTDFDLFNAADRDLLQRGLNSIDLDTKNLYSQHRKLIVQIIAATVSSFSVLATLVTFYWFCRMTKRFRHK
jgi:hypothetical protein